MTRLVRRVVIRQCQVKSERCSRNTFRRGSPRVDEFLGRGSGGCRHLQKLDIRVFEFRNLHVNLKISSFSIIVSRTYLGLNCIPFSLYFTEQVLVSRFYCCSSLLTIIYSIRIHPDLSRVTE